MGVRGGAPPYDAAEDVGLRRSLQFLDLLRVIKLIKLPSLIRLWERIRFPLMAA